MSMDDLSIEVFRKAYELSSAHGRHGSAYALKLAEEALAEGEVEERQFWHTVA